MLWDAWADSFDSYHAGGEYQTQRAVEMLYSVGAHGDYLEMGVGTGRVAIPLAEAGASVTGVDVSTAMLSVLRRKDTQNKVMTICCDFLGLPATETYDCVYAVQSSIFHLMTQPRQTEFFAQARRLLRPGGSVVIQASVPQGDLLRPSKNLVLSDFDQDSLHFTAVITDSATQRIRMQEVIFEADSSPRLLHVEQRFIWPSEMDLMAQFSGFILTARYGDFDKTPFDRTSTKHVSVYGLNENIADSPLAAHPTSRECGEGDGRRP